MPRAVLAIAALSLAVGARGARWLAGEAPQPPAAAASSLAAVVHHAYVAYPGYTSVASALSSVKPNGQARFFPSFFLHFSFIFLRFVFLELAMPACGRRCRGPPRLGCGRGVRKEFEGAKVKRASHIH